MSRKQRLALAYCVSFVLNGLFWLAYGRELRHSGAAAPRPHDNAAALKPVVLGRYVPLPPLAKRGPKPADAPDSASGKTAADAGKGASETSRSPLAGAQAAGMAGKPGGTQGASGVGGGARGRSQAAQSGAGGAATQVAQGGQTAGGRAARNGTSGAGQAGTSAAGTRGASGTSARTQPGVGQTQSAGQKTAGAGTSGKKLAQGRKPNGKTHNAPTLKETASLAAEQKDDKEGSDTRTAEKKAEPDEPAKKPKPTSAVNLKIVKMWTPKPGQKFNLASNLNIALPKNLELVPGPPLTPEQVEELKKLLQQQKLRHVGLDRKQLKKLLEARRTTESKRPPEKNKPGGDARKREKERQAHKPKPRAPRPPTNKTPKLASASMQRPRSPFTYKQWNSDMFKRWAPREDVAETGAAQGSLGAGAQNANSAKAGSPAATGTRIASNQGVPDTGNAPGGGNAGQSDAGQAGAQGGDAPPPNNGANPTGGQTAAGNQGNAPGNPGGGLLGGTNGNGGQPAGTAQPGNGGAPPAASGGQNNAGNDGNQNQNGGVLGGTPGTANAGNPPTPGGSPAPGDNANQGGNPSGSQNQGGGLLGGSAGNTPGAPAGQPAENPGAGSTPPAGDRNNAGGGLLGRGTPGDNPGAANPPSGSPGNGNGPNPGAPGKTNNQGNAGSGRLGGGTPTGSPGGNAPGGNPPQGNPGQGDHQANAGGGLLGGGGSPPANQGNAGQGGMPGGGAPAGQPGGNQQAAGNQSNHGNAGGGLLGGENPPANAGNSPQGGTQGQNPGGAQGGLLGGGNPAPSGGNQNGGGQAPGGMLGGGAPAGGNQAPGGVLGGGAPGGNQGQQQVASADGGAPGDGTGAGASEGALFLGGEQGDGMDAGENDVQGNTEETGFTTPATASAPDLPMANPNAKKGIPGSLVLPPSPPMGTETGKLPTPRRVKKTLIQMATEGAPAAQGRQATRPLPLGTRRAPQKMAKTPVGMPPKPRRTAVRLALTVGSTSANGTLPFTVMDRPHLPIGVVSDAIDPPLPPAKGVQKSPRLAPKTESARSEQAVRSARPNKAAAPLAAKQASPPIVRTAKNSQGIKNGTEQPLPPTPLPDSDMEVGDGSGLKGEYYLGRKFDQYQFTRADPMVDFDWKAGQSPSPRIPSGTDYTIRWTGKIQPKYSETYTFYATADDGVRVWVNHKLIIDDWSLHAATQFSNKIPLQAGQQYLFKVEYLESAGGAATVQLYWDSPSQPKEFIPENAFFYPLPGDEEDMKRDKAPL